MTFKERLQIEHPECIYDDKFMDSDYGGGCKDCPCSYDYESREKSIANCLMHHGKGCTYCWRREIPVDDLKPGDMVKLRNGLMIGGYYDGVTFAGAMKFHRQATVSKVIENDGNTFVELEDNIFRYSLIMLEKVKELESENKEREGNTMAERKFNIGDKVITTKLCDCNGNKLFPVGTIGKIADVTNDDKFNRHYQVEANNDYWWYSEDMLEKIEFTTDDLKDGNLLKDRQGNIYVWLSKYPRRILECLSETQKDFKNSYSRSYDIVEVRDSSGYRCGGIESLMKNYDNFPIIWKEKETKELSLKELKSILVEKYPNIDEFRIPQISDLVI